jgi:phosphohistidine phosphatase
MKTLILMRHAKSSWDNPQQTDHDRPLNKRGKRNAPEMGERFAMHKIMPDTIVSSSAVRAESTARLVMEAAHWTAPLLIRPELYHATSGTWVSVLRELSGGSIIAFGHNPGISEFVNRLTREGVSLPTAAVAFVEIDIKDWSELSFDSPSRLVDLWTPKDED